MKKKMTEKQLANLKPFRKGQSGNPKGRPKRMTTLLYMDNNPAHRLTYDDVRAVIEVQMLMTEEQLKNIVFSDDAAMYEKVIARAIMKDAASGQIFNLETLLSRLYGRPKEQVDVNVNKTNEVVPYYLPVPDFTDAEVIDTTKIPQNGNGQGKVEI